jgi:hypothetical protein
MAMQRARRLASVVVVASLGVTGLSACQQAPSVAAYLGSLGEISESRVQQVWDSTNPVVLQAAKAEAAKPSGAVVSMPTRSDIVTTLIAVKVLNQVAQARGLTATPDKVLDQDAAALHVPANTEYMQLYAQWDSLVTQLKTGAANAPDAGDADLQQVFQVLLANKLVAPGTTFASFKSQLPDQNKTLVKVAVAARDEIKQVTDPLHIKVNPRYQPATLPVLNFQTDANSPLKPLISLPLGSNKATAPVSDVS